MQLTTAGLWLNFVGSVLLGFSAQFGSAAGWGGKLNISSKGWRVANVLGWLLLSIGFLLQVL